MHWHLTHHMEERLLEPSYRQLKAAFFFFLIFNTVERDYSEVNCIAAFTEQNCFLKSSLGKN